MLYRFFKCKFASFFLCLISFIYFIMQASAKKNHLGSILKEIYDEDVALQPDHLDKVQILAEFLEEFKKFCFNNCPVFSRLFKDFYYTGSYFEGLRVCEATEFDINIVLFLPTADFKYEVKELEEGSKDKGKFRKVKALPYATLRLLKNSDIRLENDELKSLFNDRYLILEKVRSWCQSIVAKFCSAFGNSSKSTELGILKVEKSENGPACTVKLCNSRYEYISIDLVPVFEIGVNQLRLCTFQHIHNLSEENRQNCYLVPKPLKQELSFLSANKAPKVWRINFPLAEKQIIADKDKLKTIIKLMKFLRDIGNWKIPSYYMKVVAFWLVKKHPDSHHWNDSDLGNLFLEFLQAFEQHLSSNHLDHIIYPCLNLLQAIPSTTVAGIRKRIHNIQKNLIEHPEQARCYFTTRSVYLSG